MEILKFSRRRSVKVESGTIIESDTFYLPTFQGHFGQARGRVRLFKRKNTQSSSSLIANGKRLERFTLE